MERAFDCIKHLIPASSQTASVLLGAAAGVCTTLLVQVCWRRHTAQVFKLGNLHYELIGYAWDHQVKDFKVLYRPLYDCAAKKGSFERHSFAVSHFSRWEEKFTRISSVPLSLSARIISWPAVGFTPAVVVGAVAPQVTPTSSSTQSGFGTRTLEPSITNLLGDYSVFIDTLLAGLQDKLDVSSFQMDHICYRCETTEEYSMIVAALKQHFGSVMTEANIGGRPVATVLLHEPLQHGSFNVEAVEVAAPKPGRPYRSGLEHAEFVVGSESDGCTDNRRLIQFMQDHPSVSFDTRALNVSLLSSICRLEGGLAAHAFGCAAAVPERGWVPGAQKEINADVSLSVDGGLLGAISAKFHQRPLAEVVRYEEALQRGAPPAS